MTGARGVLLVDDEPGIRRVLGLSLEDRGFAVRQAASAEEALALFRQQPAPVTLTDIKMPGMDGLALLRELKALDQDAEVVLITGHGDLDQAIQGIKLDAADFVTKPIQDDALDIALTRAFERRAMRLAIREHTEHLERLVEQKTRALLDAERLAAVGQAVAGLSHSVKNMASGLEGSLFLLRQGLEGDHRAYLEQGWEMLEANVRKLKELSLGMVRYSAAQELNLAPTDPALPARQVAALLAPRAKAAGIALELDAPEGMAPVALDEQAMHRCLLDLAGNALDACEEAGFSPSRPGGRVDIRVEPTPGAGTQYTVRDNGCGVPAELRPRLFTPFFTTKGEGGSGLGLASAKKTVDAHGGMILLQSEHGHGSEFTILIPVHYENKVL